MLRSVVLVALMAALTACGGASTAPHAAGDISGTWHLAANETIPPSPDVHGNCHVTGTLQVTQTGSTLSAELSGSAASCVFSDGSTESGNDDGLLGTGTISGNAVTLTGVFNYAGTVQGNTIAGTLTGDGAFPVTGTWQLTR